MERRNVGRLERPYENSESRALRRIMVVEEGCPYDTVCFHCQQLVALNPYAGDVRYAGDWQLPQREDAIVALDVANRIRASVLASLPLETRLDRGTSSPVDQSRHSQ